MNKEQIEVILGDMAARYEIDEEGVAGLLLYPIELSLPKKIEKNSFTDGMVQLKLVGDIYKGAYAPGNSLRESESTKRLKFKNQEKKETNDSIMINTRLMDDRGYEVIHCLAWTKGTPYLDISSSFENKSSDTVTLEMISSFSMQGISPYLDGDGHENMVVHRLRSRWSEEGKLETRTMEDLQLNPSWNLAGVRCERFGSIGSMPVNGYFPFVALEDQKNHVFWGAQLETPSSWQIEIYRENDNIAISGGIADREFGHWMKQIKPGEKFNIPRAIISTAHTKSIDIFTKRLTDAGKRYRNARPASEAELPVLFNEYCTTWGCPSHENISKILDVIKDKGFSYFVIDCGWYKQPGIPWDMGMGDYQISKKLFPDGLDKTVSLIKENGLKPGIWFEIENVGPAADAYENKEHLLKRDGMALTTTRRRFWDMADPWVIKYLDKRVIGLLKEYGFQYLKVDYNDEIGIGCDGSESQGEGLRKNMMAVYDYFEKIQKEVPEIIIENCASGGHRLEPGFMARSSMASFSDAHECEEIPIVAANLHRAILPEQSQIWAVIRRDDSLKRIVYSITSTFLGRMCVSGDVTNLEKSQWQIIEKGISFYKKIAPIIKDGQSHLYQNGIEYMHHPKGWQVLIRVGENKKAYITIHIFGGTLPKKIQVKLPKETPEKIIGIYSDQDENVEIKEGVLNYVPRENEKALALFLG